MTTPAELKFALDALLVKLARGGPLPTITGIHSVYTEGDHIHVAYDLANADAPLDFDFERPAVVGRDELQTFACWLAWSDYGAITH